MSEINHKKEYVDAVPEMPRKFTLLLLQYNFLHVNPGELASGRLRERE